MNNIAGLAIFALGIVLLIFGSNESPTIGSSVSSAVSTGNPIGRAIWMSIGGGAAVILGLLLALRSRN